MAKLVTPTLPNVQNAWLLLLLAITSVFVLSLVSPQASAQQLAAQRPGSPKWATELKSGRYKIHSDFPLESPQGIVNQLEQLENDIHDLLGIRSPREASIHLVLFKTASEYERYMQAYFPALPKRRALFYQHSGPGMLFAHWHADVMTDLRHEVTHGLLNNGKHPLPLWLDEGLAEYFERVSNERHSANPYLAEIAGLGKKADIKSLRELQAISDVGFFTNEHYRDSWAWVHFLVHRKPETREVLVRYLRDHQADRPTVDLCLAVDQLFPNQAREVYEHFRAMRHDEKPAASSHP